MAEIEVTKAMVRAGVDAGKLIHSDSAVQFWLADIYRAMRALEPSRMDDAESRRFAALDAALRCGPSQKDVIPLAREIEVYLRGDNTVTVTEVVLPNAVDVTVTVPEAANPQVAPQTSPKESWQTFADVLTNFCHSHGVMLWTGLAASSIMATLVDSEEPFHYDSEPLSGGRSAIIRRVLSR